MYSTVQETQPPGQVLTGSHFLTLTITPGSTRPTRYVITLNPGDELKVLLVDNNSPRVVPGNINCHKSYMALLVNNWSR